MPINVPISVSVTDPEMGTMAVSVTTIISMTDRDDHATTTMTVHATTTVTAAVTVMVTMAVSVTVTDGDCRL